ncbi:MAG TPA: exopolysaccharide biosynthesis protein [Opitutaceae bacterium]|nr:exopolysaccharide biosynthesis protein [Opitutaceae bacterium]
MNTTLAPSVPRSRPRPLSEQLRDLRTTFSDHPATLQEIIVALEGRAFALLMILFALPFAAPISLPGSSTPLGLIIAVIAVQLAFGRLPWLPRRVRQWRVPPGFFARVVPMTQRIVRALERVLHPRWPKLTDSALLRGAHLLTLCAAALLLALPIPFPFSNTFPAWAILLLGCGLLERDGVFIATGYLAFAASLVFVTLLGGAISEALAHTWHWLVG